MIVQKTLIKEYKILPKNSRHMYRHTNIIPVSYWIVIHTKKSYQNRIRSPFSFSIFTVAFLLFLAPAGDSNPGGTQYTLPNLK